jgi:hypothetical protein
MRRQNLGFPFPGRIIPHGVKYSPTVRHVPSFETRIKNGAFRDVVVSKSNRRHSKWRFVTFAVNNLKSPYPIDPTKLAARDQ